MQFAVWSVVSGPLLMTNDLATGGGFSSLSFFLFSFFSFFFSLSFSFFFFIFFRCSFLKRHLSLNGYDAVDNESKAILQNTEVIAVNQARQSKLLPLPMHTMMHG